MSTTGEGNAKRRRVFYGWWVVAASGIISAFGAGTWFYGFGVYFKAIQEEFDWTRGLTGFTTSLSRAEGSIVAPFAGWLIDKFGPRRPAFICAALVGIGFFLLAGVNSLLTFLLVYGGLMSIGASIAFWASGSAAIANWFSKKVSRAFAFYNVGNGLGPAVLLPVLAWLLVCYGWRTAVIISGVALFALVLPLTLVLRHRPEQYGYLPDGEVVRAEEAEAPKPEDQGQQEEKASEEVSFTARQALKTRAFYLLMLAQASRTVGLATVSVHQVAYLNDIGYSYAFASTILGLMTFMNLPGTFGLGWLGDVMDIRYPLILSHVFMALGVFMLSDIKNVAFIYLYLVFFGIGFGGQVPLGMAIMRKYFGRRAYASIRGWHTFLLLPATIAGPWFAGWIHDLYQSYYLAFMVVMAMYIAGGVIMFFARHPRPPATRPVTN